MLPVINHANFTNFTNSKYQIFTRGKQESRSSLTRQNWNTPGTNDKKYLPNTSGPRKTMTKHIHRIIQEGACEQTYWAKNTLVKKTWLQGIFLKAVEQCGEYSWTPDI